MICFRDRTYCSAQCGTMDCTRKFTDADRESARRWWGADDAPIAFGDLSIGCVRQTPPNELEIAA